MTEAEPDVRRTQSAEEPARRVQILNAALQVFTRFGYRKTSMDDVAQAAGISRPGLYLHFSTKQALFRDTVTRALEVDLDAADRVLADAGLPLRERLIAAFDHWTGRYIGPISRDLAALVDSHPDLLGPDVAAYPGRFAALITAALVTASAADRRPVAQDAAATLLSAAIGIKHDSGTREEFLGRFARTVDLVLLALDPAPGRPRG